MSTSRLPRSSLLFVLAITGCSLVESFLPESPDPKPRPRPAPVASTYEVMATQQSPAPAPTVFHEFAWRGFTPPEPFSGRMGILDGYYRRTLKVRASRRGLEEVVWRELTGGQELNDGFQLLFTWDPDGRARDLWRGDTIRWNDPRGALRFGRLY